MKSMPWVFPLLVCAGLACSRVEPIVQELPAQQDPESRPTSKPADSAPASQPNAKGTEFARFTKDDKDNGRFETAIVTYENKDGVQVSLIAAIHIADKKHYQDLNEDFERYDALLYELVGSPEDRPLPGDTRRGDSPISMFQRMLQRGLQLAFQLDEIDYSPENFVHADLTPQGFEDAMEARGESILTNLIDMMGRSQKAMNERKDDESLPADEPIDFVKAMRTGYGKHRIRMTFAQSLMAMESMAAGVDPEEEDNGTVLLEGRNDRALEVMIEQIAAGKRNLGIYYGAAHMPDIEAKMIKNHGFEKKSTRWLLAWDITRRKDK